MKNIKLDFILSNLRLLLKNGLKKVSNISI